MKLTVHIGTTKTGSTSIQAFLAQNRDALFAQGVLYPRDLGPQHHVNATVAALDHHKSPDLMRFCGIDGKRQHTAFRKQTARAFNQEIAQSSGVEHVIISSEHLHSRCVAPEAIRRFQSLFCQGFDQVEIVVYVRPQIDHMVSLFSTNLRHGFNGTLEDHITAMLAPKHTSYFNLQNVITRWSDVFGTDAVTVRPFAALNRETGGAISDFCALANIDTTDLDMTDVAASNAAINPKGQELLMILNARKGVPVQTRHHVVKWLEKEFKGSGIKPTPEMIETVQSQFIDSNAWVIETYFPDHPDYLAPRS